MSLDSAELAHTSFCDIRGIYLQGDARGLFKEKTGAHRGWDRSLSFGQKATQWSSSSVEAPTYLVKDRDSALNQWFVYV